MTHDLVVPLHASGRSNSAALMYFRMCSRSLISYRHRVKQLKDLDRLDTRYDDVYSSVAELAVEPVVYAGMCLEATLYDLAACLFGEEFVEHTDKLDPLGKFFVIAEFVDREPPNKGAVTYQTIQAVITARNRLVHPKSQPGIYESNIEKMINQAQKEHQRHIAGINASFRSLVLLSLYFDGDIFESLRIIPSFKKQEYWIDFVQKELHDDVIWCIDASLKERQQSKSEPTIL